MWSVSTVDRPFVAITRADNDTNWEHNCLPNAVDTRKISNGLKLSGCLCEWSMLDQSTVSKGTKVIKTSYLV